MTTLLKHVIQLNGLQGCRYFEPYAGGAGAALRLLREGIVSEIYLNDLDVCIAAFWRSVLKESKRFAERILSVQLTVDEWRNQAAIYADSQLHSEFDVGFATFYLNRCSRSGVLHGAGPIGGYTQSGKWKVGVRFYRKTLVDRVYAIEERKDSIHITNMDAIEFLKKQLPKGRGRSRAFVFLDPPYHGKGSRLYLNFYRDKDHQCLSDYLSRQNVLKWIMSYDSTEFIQELYGDHTCSSVPIRYSLQSKRNAEELLISPHYLRTPTDVCPVENGLVLALAG